MYMHVCSYANVSICGRTLRSLCRPWNTFRDSYSVTSFSHFIWLMHGGVRNPTRSLNIVNGGSFLKRGFVKRSITRTPLVSPAYGPAQLGHFLALFFALLQCAFAFTNVSFRTSCHALAVVGHTLLYARPENPGSSRRLPAETRSRQQSRCKKDHNLKVYEYVEY